MILLAALLGLSLMASAPADARTITWSGYTWSVRDQGLSAPGPNLWSEKNVRVEGSELVLAVARDGQGRWSSAQVQNVQHLGYGTYRWVVTTDLSSIDAHDVLGMYTWGEAPPSYNEIDIEAARWGSMAWPTGSCTLWQDALSNPLIRQTRTFNYSPKPPYVNQFTWEPTSVAYHITDAAGTVLLDWTVTSGVPAPSVEVPIINYWRYGNQPPTTAKSVRIATFQFTPHIIR